MDADERLADRVAGREGSARCSGCATTVRSLAVGLALVVAGGVALVVVLAGGVVGAIVLSAVTVLVYYAVANAAALRLGDGLAGRLAALGGLVGCPVLAVALLATAA